MTIAEQLAQVHRNDRYRSFGTYLLGFLAVIVPIMAAFLAFNISKTADVSGTVKRELAQATAAICASRATTLRTAPLTVREIRAAADATSPAARKVCPRLDYAGLARQQAAEAASLRAGADPAELATGLTGKAGAIGPAGSDAVNR